MDSEAIALVLAIILFSMVFVAAMEAIIWFTI